MNNISLLQSLTAIFGIAMSLAHFPQAYKIWKRKSAEDISLLTYSVFCLGVLCWLIYGIVLKDWVIIATFIPGVVGAWSVFFLSLYYRNKLVS